MIRLNSDAAKEQEPAAERIITISGLILSIALTVALPLLITDPNSEVEQALQIEVILAIAGFLMGWVLTMDLALRSRIRELDNSLSKRMREGEDLRLGALPLQRLLSVPAIEVPLREVVAAAADAKAKRMPFLANRVIDRIKRDSDETIKIAQGVFRCENWQEEHRLLSLALADSRATLHAVAALGLDHWRSPEFQEYFEIFLDHAPRLQETRIFLVTPEEMEEEDMLRLLRKHADAGVDTFAINKRLVPQNLRRPVVLFDKALLLLHSPRWPATERAEVQFTDDPSAVQDAYQVWNSLLRMARREESRALLWPLPPSEPT